MTNAEAWQNKAHSRTHHRAVHAPEAGGVWISSVLPKITGLNIGKMWLMEGF